MAGLQEMLERAVQEIGFLKRRQKLAKTVIRAHESKSFFLEEISLRIPCQEKQREAAEAAAEDRSAAECAQGAAVNAALDLAGARLETDVTHRTLTLLKLQRDSAREDVELARHSESMALEHCREMVSDAEKRDGETARLLEVVTARHQEVELRQHQVDSLEAELRDCHCQLAAREAAQEATSAELHSLQVRLEKCQAEVRGLESKVASLEEARQVSAEDAKAAVTAHQLEAATSAARAASRLAEIQQAAAADVEARGARCAAADERTSLAEQRLAAALERAQLAEVRLAERSSLEQERVSMAEERLMLNHGLSQDRAAAAEERAERVAANAAERIATAEEKAQRSAQRAADAEGAAEEQVASLRAQAATADAKLAAVAAMAAKDIERSEAAAARCSHSAADAEARAEHLQRELQQMRDAVAQLQEARGQPEVRQAHASLQQQPQVATLEHETAAAAGGLAPSGRHVALAAPMDIPGSPAPMVQDVMQAVGDIINSMPSSVDREVRHPRRAAASGQMMEATQVALPRGTDADSTPQLPADNVEKGEPQEIDGHRSENQLRKNPRQRAKKQKPRGKASRAAEKGLSSGIAKNIGSSGTIGSAEKDDVIVRNSASRRNGNTDIQGSKGKSKGKAEQQGKSADVVAPMSRARTRKHKPAAEEEADISVAVGAAGDDPKDLSGREAQTSDEGMSPAGSEKRGAKRSRNAALMPTICVASEASPGRFSKADVNDGRRTRRRRAQPTAYWLGTASSPTAVARGEGLHIASPLTTGNATSSPAREQQLEQLALDVTEVEADQGGGAQLATGVPDGQGARLTGITIEDQPPEDGRGASTTAGGATAKSAAAASEGEVGKDGRDAEAPSLPATAFTAKEAAGCTILVLPSDSQTEGASNRRAGSHGAQRVPTSVHSGADDTATEEAVSRPIEAAAAGGGGGGSGSGSLLPLLPRLAPAGADGGGREAKGARGHHLGSRPQGITKVDLNSVWGPHRRPPHNARDVDKEIATSRQSGGVPNTVAAPLDALNPTVLTAAAARRTVGLGQKASYQRAWLGQAARSKVDANRPTRKLHKPTLNSFAGSMPPTNMLFSGAFKIPRLLTGN